MDSPDKADTQCKVYEKRNNEWQQIGQTEVAINNLNPDFRSFTVDYYFEKVQRLKFSVVDVEDSDYDLIGEVEVTLGSLMGANR